MPQILWVGFLNFLTIYAVHSVGVLPFQPMLGHLTLSDICYQFRILRNLRIDIKERLEEYSQSIEL